MVYKSLYWLLTLLLPGGSGGSWRGGSERVIKVELEKEMVGVVESCHGVVVEVVMAEEVGEKVVRL